MEKKHIKCPECGHEFEAEVELYNDPNLVGLAGAAVGALAGFCFGGPVGACAGATFGGRWGKRTGKTFLNSVDCPKCKHSIELNK